MTRPPPSRAVFHCGLRPVLALAALLAWLLPALAQGAPAVERRIFRDWQGGLSVAGLGWIEPARTPKAGGRPARIELLRSGTPGAPWHVVIVTLLPLDREKPVVLNLDGRIHAVGPGQLAARDAPEALAIQHPETLSALQAGLRGGRTLGLSATDRAGAPVTAQLSLGGLAAAMLWLDERQGRAGTPQTFAPIAAPAQGPFHAPQAGGGPDGIAVSVALPPRERWPQALRDLPPAVLERHVLLGSCEEPDLAGGHGGFWTARLDPWTTLYGVSCTRGAYNVADRLYVVTAGDFENLQPLTFAEPDGVDGWDATDVLVNAAVDEATGTLTAVNKARGAGDCGTLGTWAWTGQRFSLREYRAEPQCNGRPPEAWPVLFRARPK